jgi:hypothetical protein
MSDARSRPVKADPITLVDPLALAARIESDGIVAVATDPDLLVEATEEVIIAALVKAYGVSQFGSGE